MAVGSVRIGSPPRAKARVRLKGVGAQAPTGRVRLVVGSTTVTAAATVRKVDGVWTATLTTAKLPRGPVKIVYGGNANLCGAVYATGRTVR